MLLFKDVVSGDEIITDSYDLKEVDGIVYEADCAMITEGAVNVDTGANASAEEAEETFEDQGQKVNNILHSFRYNETPPFDKAGYKKHLSGYMKLVRTSLQEKGASEDEIKAFMEGATKYLKNTILPNFKDYEFYVLEHGNLDGMHVLLNYREDGVTPYITFWKHGCVQEKI